MNPHLPYEPSSRSLEDQAYDLLGKLIFEHEAQEMLAEIENAKACGDTQEMDAFFARYDQKNQERIDKYIRKRKTKRFFTKTLPKAAQIAAAFITVITLAGGVAVATSHTIRVEVMRLLVNIEDEYTELRLRKDPEASFDIPADWQGENYPSYIPKGMALGTVHALPTQSFVEYVDPETEETVLSFYENGAAIETNVDTEGATIQPVTIRGNLGFIAKKENILTVCWSNGQYYFLLTMQNTDEATLIRVAESVLRIN